MSMPSPFELGAAVGGNVREGIRGAFETDALDNILRQAQQSNDPNFQNDVIRQILTRVSPEKQQAALSVIQNKQAQMQRQSQRQALMEKGYNPDLPESVLKEEARLRREAFKSGQEEMSEQQNKMRTAQSALNQVKRARQLAQGGSLGPVIPKFGGTTRDLTKLGSKVARQERAEFARIGKGLVQAAAPLKITNKAEFLHYAEGLDDPDATREEILGNLDGIEGIILDTLGIQQEESQMRASGASSSEYVRMLAPDGSIKRIPLDQVKAAEAAGGALIE